jgi:hypothetical protein
MHGGGVMVPILPPAPPPSVQLSLANLGFAPCAPEKHSYRKQTDLSAQPNRAVRARKLQRAAST